MDEIAPGLYDWTTFHDGIGQPVHSHFHAPSGTLIDPRVPQGGVEGVAAVARPQRIVLTNRHHRRHAEAFVEAFDCPMLVHPDGLAEVPGAQPIAPGDRLADGVEVVAVGAITPEEIGVRLAVEEGWLALADIAVVLDGRLAFVPDELLGEDPEATRAAMLAALRRLLDEVAFSGLLLAHGTPLPDGRERLESLVDEWTPTS